MLSHADKAEANLTAAPLLTTANARITALEAEIVTLKAASSGFEAKITVLTGEVTTAQAATAAKDVELKKAQTDLVAEKAKRIDALEVLAGQSLLPDALPSTEPNANATCAAKAQVTKLREQIAASNDPQEKFKLSVQIRELLAAKRK